MPHHTSHSVVNGDIVSIIRARDRQVLKEGSVAAAGVNWILVGAMKYTHLRATEFENKAVGRCIVEVVKRVPEGPWAA